MGKIGENGNIFLDVYASNLVQSLINNKTVKGGSVIKAYRYCFYILGHDKKQCGHFALFDNLPVIAPTNLSNRINIARHQSRYGLWFFI